MDETGLDCHGHGINQMPDVSTKISDHCHAQSEIVRLSPDGISSISNFGVLDNDDNDDELLFMLEDLKNFSTSFEELSQLLEGEPSESPSIEVTTPLPPPPPPPPPPFPLPPSHTQNDSLTLRCDERLTLRRRHKHSQSMDGYSSFNSELLTLSMGGSSSTEKRKTMSEEKLINIALVDPKRAKRIWANRQSAARSKERRMQYMVELERKVQTLQTEATIFTTQISLVQRDIVEMTAENSELKLQLQPIEQQINFQDALNDAMVEEIERLRITMRHMSSNGRDMTNLEHHPFQELQSFATTHFREGTPNSSIASTHTTRASPSASTDSVHVARIASAYRPENEGTNDLVE